VKKNDRFHSERISTQSEFVGVKLQARRNIFKSTGDKPIEWVYFSSLIGIGSMLVPKVNGDTSPMSQYVPSGLNYRYFRHF
jgi:hypothetical protein